MATAKRELANAQRALREFAEASTAQTGAPRDTLDREFGELFLTLLRLADRLNVDLIKAVEQVIEQRAATAPRLVTEPPAASRPGRPPHTR